MWRNFIILINFIFKCFLQCNKQSVSFWMFELKSINFSAGFNYLVNLTGMIYWFIDLYFLATTHSQANTHVEIYTYTFVYKYICIYIYTCVPVEIWYLISLIKKRGFFYVVGWLGVWFVVVYGISTLDGYLMSNPVCIVERLQLFISKTISFICKQLDWWVSLSYGA